MNKREKILIAVLVVCSIVTGGSLVICCSLNDSLKKTSEFMSVLELQGVVIPKIYIGEKYLFGEAFNFSNWSYSPKQMTYLERYSSHLGEVITIMKSQVYLLGEDPELFEQCLYAIHDFQRSINSSRIGIPYVAWRGRYSDCPMSVYYYSGEPSKYDDTEVWAIMILFNDIFGIMTTYYVDTETQKQLPFVLGTN